MVVVGSLAGREAHYRRVAKKGAMATGSGEVQAKWLYLAEL